MDSSRFKIRWKSLFALEIVAIEERRKKQSGNLFGNEIIFSGAYVAQILCYRRGWLETCVL